MGDIENANGARIEVEGTIIEKKASPIKRKSEAGAESPAKKVLKKEEDQPTADTRASGKKVEGEGPPPQDESTEAEKSVSDVKGAGADKAAEVGDAKSPDAPEKELEVVEVKDDAEVKEQDNTDGKLSEPEKKGTSAPENEPAVATTEGEAAA